MHKFYEIDHFQWELRHELSGSLAETNQNRSRSCDCHSRQTMDGSDSLSDGQTLPCHRSMKKPSIHLLLTCAAFSALSLPSSHQVNYDGLPEVLR